MRPTIICLFYVPKLLVRIITGITGYSQTRTLHRSDRGSRVYCDCKALRASTPPTYYSFPQQWLDTTLLAHQAEQTFIRLTYWFMSVCFQYFCVLAHSAEVTTGQQMTQTHRTPCKHVRDVMQQSVGAIWHGPISILKTKIGLTFESQIFVPRKH